MLRVKRRNLVIGFLLGIGLLTVFPLIINHAVEHPANTGTKEPECHYNVLPQVFFFETTKEGIGTVQIHWQTICAHTISQTLYLTGTYPDSVLFQNASYWEKHSVSSVELEHYRDSSFVTSYVCELHLLHGNRYFFRIQSDPGQILSLSTETQSFTVFHDSFTAIRVGVIGDYVDSTSATKVQGVMKKDHPIELVCYLGDRPHLPDFKLNSPGTMQQIPLSFSHRHHMEYYQKSEKNITTYFAQSFGHARFLFLDSVHLEEQLAWLKDELESEASEKAVHRIVLMHIPPFIEYWTSTHWNSDKQLSQYFEENYVPAFEKASNRVDMVISGHSGVYQRGIHRGIAYTIVGGSGNAQKVASHDFYDQSLTRRGQHFGVLRFDTCFFDWEAYDEDGGLVDHHLIGHWDRC